MSATHARLALATLLCAAAVACTTPAAVPDAPPLGRGTRTAPIVPDRLDHASADLAVAVLADDPDAVVRALGALEVAERSDVLAEGASGLVPAGLEAASAVLHRGLAARDAARALLERDDLDDASRERIERQLADDPLELARDRIGDARFTSFARFFNTFSEPIGRSVLNTTLLPYTLGHAVVRYSLDLAEDDTLPVQRRQALVHWETFRRRHPDAPEVATLAASIDTYEAKRAHTLHERAMARGEKALEQGAPDYSVIYARRALRYEEDDEARELLAEAERRIEERRVALAWAQEFDPGASVPASGAEPAIVVAVLSGAQVGGAVSDDDPLADERRFLAANERGRAGDDDGMWEALEVLRDEGLPSWTTAWDESVDHPMARHATALLASATRHPYGAFEQARSDERWRTTTWLLLGPLAARPDTDAIGATRYLLDLPYRVQAAALFPVRLLLEWPWRGPTPGDARTAVHARRYLALHPDGAHAAEVRDWLLDFETGRENWVGALRVAEGDPAFEDAELDTLRERAAEQALRVASAEERSDLRAGLLTNVARTFPETRAGREAGGLAREQAEERTVHEIRLTRGFLLENPSVAGPAGLDLAPGLLDENVRNGELHPDGVALVGGRDVVVSVIAEGGDEDDPPEELPARLSDEKLARLVARLEETSFRNALLDPDDALVADPARDAVFERARLGLADDVDERPAAEARFAYEGMRERYGMVRGREALLPVELVLQGSLIDLSLGAFPRLRPPEETPDALLYR